MPRISSRDLVILSGGHMKDCSEAKKAGGEWWPEDLVPEEIEYKFHVERRWRVDFVFLHPKKLAIEIEGAVWKFGRHNHPVGFLKDMEKYNALAEAGFSLLRYQPGKIDYDQIRRVLNDLPHLRP